MKPIVSLLRRLGFQLVVCAVTGLAHAEEFTIQPGDIVAENVPGPGAGLIPSPTSVDIYTFEGTAGDILFIDELSVAATFQGWLMWRITAPDASTVFNGYLDGHAKGRRVLPKSGLYTVRVWVGANNPAYTGAYSFCLRPVPPDPVFPIQIGDTIADGLPGSGAGHIEVPGASDLYTFEATAGQIAFFEEIEAAGTFAGWLKWELRSPSDTRLFESYFDSGDVGRIVFTNSGTYRIRAIAGANDPAYIGAYSFRIRAVPPDDVFAIQVGGTVSDGVPGPGAGHIELAGAEDHYTFEGVAGQDLFFDGIGADPSLGGWLKCELRAPGGQIVFSSYFTNGGRKKLPATGTYSLRFRVGVNNPALVGAYSFRITPVGDSAFGIRIGDAISPDLPAAGAGRIEDPGGQDFYSFEGIEGQHVNFEQTTVDSAFAGYLSWEVKKPDGTIWFSDFFHNGRRNRQRLPTTGTYTIRVFVRSQEPSHVGGYAFRTWCDVSALPDTVATSPGSPLAVPVGSLICDDLAEPGDTLAIELPSPQSANGGMLLLDDSALTYTPPVGFEGADSFEYRLRGQLGGSSTNRVTVHVVPDGSQKAAIVGFTRAGPTEVSLCLLGAATREYLVEESTNLVDWVTSGSVTTDDDGTAGFLYRTTNGPVRFHRFRSP